MPLPLVKPPASLCILRLSAIGDVVHAVALLRTLQAAWPDTRITWIIGRIEAALVGDIPGVEFIIFDKSRGRRAYADVRRTLRGRQFDVLLHMQAALRASLISTGIRADIRLGFDRERARDFQWLFTNHQIAPGPRQHVLDGFFGFAEALGIHERQLRWDIPIPDAARAFVGRQIEADRRVLVINPCTSVRKRNWRNWSVEGYAQVADHAALHLGMQVVLTGGPAAAERDYARQIAARMTSRPVDLVGATTLKELLAVIARADVMIAPDTGPMHMAAAVGTPVIGLFATSNPLRTGPYLSQPWVVNKYPEALEAEYGLTVESAPWGKRVRSPEAMDLIRPEDVVAMLERVLAAGEEGAGD